MYTQSEQRAISKAIKILESKMVEKTHVFTDPNTVANFLKLQYAEEQNEVFGVIFMDSQNAMISFRKVFFGTIDSASVYPRVIVQLALQDNACSCICVHNHPSNFVEASHADIQITKKLKDALSLIDVALHDHFIVGGVHHTSMAQRGLM